jgi:hypothetical protein
VLVSDLSSFPFVPLPLPDPDVACSLTEWERVLLEWDTTPRDLREVGQKSLPGFVKAQGLPHGRAMRLMEADRYKVARRQLAVEKGELNYKVRAILDVAYDQALTGNKDARRDWLNHYEAEVPATTNLTPPTSPLPIVPDHDHPLDPTEMSDAQLQERMEQWQKAEGNA